MNELLTTREMGEADQIAIAGGIAGIELMENAGRAVADTAAKMVRAGARIVVLCGPGNNGGDGIVAARLLRDRGFDVRLYLLGDPSELKGDAAAAARKWPLPIRHAGPDALQSMHLVIDALFGAGLSRPLDGAAAELVNAINESGLPVLAVDVPSGLDGTTGRASGPVVKARRTVTFFRKKPGHVLMPGRALCGVLEVVDIGIPETALSKLGVTTFENAPPLWIKQYPWPAADGHKYGRGHAVVVSGPAQQTGAARLGARAALRAGAGLVTVIGGMAATAVNSMHLTAVMVHQAPGPKAVEDFLADKRRNACLIGPGAGVDADTADVTEAILKSDAAAVLDADAITSFAAPQDDQQPSGMGFLSKSSTGDDAPAPERLFELIKARQSPVVLTPHEGEFKRLFGESDDGKLERARRAAALSGAVVILKGSDTVIAAPDGRAVINSNAPAWLATAGSGDVLAGLVLGLLAQRMPAFEAACAAVWLHGAAANAFGIGLIAEDLPEVLPKVLQELHALGRG